LINNIDKNLTMDDNKILGYVVFYLEEGEPIINKDGITEIPLMIEQKIINPLLKEKFENDFKKNYLPREDELINWLREAEKEKCVDCGTETPYTINTHIDLREYYIEGSGQLCKECYKKIYDEYERNSTK